MRYVPGYPPRALPNTSTPSALRPEQSRGAVRFPMTGRLTLAIRVVGAGIALSSLVACSVDRTSPVGTVPYHRIFVLYCDSSGKNCRQTPTGDQGGREAYSFSFRQGDVERISPNLTEGVRGIVTEYGWAPGACRSDFVVLNVQPQQLGGLTAIVKCPDTK